MAKYGMYKYVVTGVSKKGLHPGDERVWSREVNATDANDAKRAAVADWNERFGPVHLFRPNAKRVGPASLNNLADWKEV